jgi:type IV secretion system protein VirB4
MLPLSGFRSKALGLSDLLPWAALLEPGIVLQKDGSLLACWEIRGQDADSLDADHADYIAARANAAALALGTGWMIHVDAMRRPDTSYPAPWKSRFPDRVSAMIDDERRENFSAGYYSTYTVVTAIYKAPLLEDKLVAVATENERSNLLEKSLETFKKGLHALEVICSSFLKLKRLESYLEEDEFSRTHEYSPLLSFLKFCAIGEYHPLMVPSFASVYLDALLAAQDLTGGLEPRIGTII